MGKHLAAEKQIMKLSFPYMTCGCNIIVSVCTVVDMYPSKEEGKGRNFPDSSLSLRARRGIFFSHGATEKGGHVRSTKHQESPKETTFPSRQS